jgi:hypothetical protein
MSKMGGVQQKYCDVRIDSAHVMRFVNTGNASKIIIAIFKNMN